ncbi:hypothetical protein GGX14DRAFT_391076 [Mycena pura]|uniref:Uncharacterized protein n=1 Tax=Mycena pura TaxID=153505 RepID=A0AAD6VV14_9AGAR|nr:hypothetical protein GGX14DRAFT_391076 [Mycena pura]
MLNPYAMQGWQNPAGSSSSSSSSSTRPSIFGALPFPSPDTLLPTFFAFRFTSFSPSILNCTVLGPGAPARPYFRILTDAPLPGVSVFQNAQGQNVALVQWKRHPEAEIRGVTPRQRTAELVALAPDRSSRSMMLNDSGITFMPRDNFIWLHSTATQPELLGRITRGQTSVTLELTGEAIHLGLLEAAVVATFLLQCGRNID